LSAGSIALAASTATASTFSWTFQRVDQAPSGPSKQVALGMRVGATWPTVFYDGGYSMPNTMVASSMTPAGWSAANLQAQTTPSYMRAKAGQDGRVGLTWQRNNEIRFAQSSRLGWQSTSVATLTSSAGAINAPDVAYLSGNRPVVAYADNGAMKVLAYDNLAWTADTVTSGSPGDSITVDTDSQDRIGVAYNSNGTVSFALKDMSLGTWFSTTVRTGPAGNLSLAFGPNDEAGLAMLSNGVLEFAYFDTQVGAWKRDLLASNVTSSRVNLAFDGQGHPALAYVAGSEVHYRINNGSGWADALLPTGTDPDSALDVTVNPQSDAGLAFDGDDLPVIAYHATAGLVLAYDPIVTPEPVSSLLLLAGMVMLATRRNAR
jgi:hypothetical protein